MSGFLTQILDALRETPWYAVVVGAFFGDQSNRLVRENWGGTRSVKEDPVTGEPEFTEMGATQLAEELFTMMSPTAPTSTNGPVTINQQPGLPGLTINGTSQAPLDFPGADFTPPGALTINGGDVNIGGNTINIGGTTIDQGPTTINIGGGTTINIPGQPPIVIPPLPPLPPIPPPTTTPTPPPQQQPQKPTATVFMGVVTGGGGNSYTMNCLGKGAVTVTVPQIAADFTIPTGTWGVVVGVKSESDELGADEFDYYFQPPVWLA